MRNTLYLGVVLLGLSLAGRAAAGEPTCCPPPESSWLHRLAPVGGWSPDGRGLLNWWNPYCYPCCGTRDDYCRKPLPPTCWPPYPPFYTYGPPDVPSACARCASCPTAPGPESSTPTTP